MPYAQGTSVPVEKTKAEIETLLRKRGCSKFGSLEDGPVAVVVFELNRKAIRFTMPLPKKEDFAYRKEKPTWHRLYTRKPEEQYRLWEQACRQKWRSLLLGIKAKFSNVDSGIATFEEEFMGRIVMPDGRTVAEHVLPRVEEAYLSGKAMPLLPSGGGAS